MPIKPQITRELRIVLSQVPNPNASSDPPVRRFRVVETEGEKIVVTFEGMGPGAVARLVEKWVYGEK